MTFLATTNQDSESTSFSSCTVYNSLVNNTQKLISCGWQTIPIRTKKKECIGTKNIFRPFQPGVHKPVLMLIIHALFSQIIITSQMEKTEKGLSYLRNTSLGSIWRGKYAESESLVDSVGRISHYSEIINHTTFF